MSTKEQHQTDHRSDDGPSPDPAMERLEESIASQARIAPRRRGPEAPTGDPRAGGDASKAPLTLSQTELGPIEGDSSGVSWDDPDEL
jgi:hypothetical protein